MKIFITIFGRNVIIHENLGANNQLIYLETRYSYTSCKGQNYYILYICNEKGCANK